MNEFLAIIIDWELLSRDERWDLSGRNPANRKAVAFKALACGWVDRFPVFADTAASVYQMLNVNQPENYKLRQMCVGDLIFNATTGKLHIVESVGFEVLSG